MFVNLARKNRGEKHKDAISRLESSLNISPCPSELAKSITFELKIGLNLVDQEDSGNTLYHPLDLFKKSIRCEEIIVKSTKVNFEEKSSEGKSL